MTTCLDCLCSPFHWWCLCSALSQRVSHQIISSLDTVLCQGCLAEGGVKKAVPAQSPRLSHHDPLQAGYSLLHIDSPASRLRSAQNVLFLTQLEVLGFTPPLHGLQMQWLWAAIPFTAEHFELLVFTSIAPASPSSPQCKYCPMFPLTVVIKKIKEIILTFQLMARFFLIKME